MTLVQNRIGGVLLCVMLLAMAGCSSLNGNVHLFKSNEYGELMGAWHGAENAIGVIRKKGEGDVEKGEDSFAIYFNTAHFKYMPDLGNSNEIVAVFTFTEKNADSNGGEIVKIIGPIEHIADGSFSPYTNIVSYGPKRLDSDVLTVRVQLIEYDADENEESSAFLDFIGNAASALSLSNPITSEEIKVAKEIGKALISQNENDLILDSSFGLLPYDVNAAEWSSKVSGVNNKVLPIPLKAGNYAIIKQEQCRWFDCYGYFYDKTSGGTAIVSLVVDVLKSPIVLTRRIFFDSPSDSATDDFYFLNDKVAKDSVNIISIDGNTKVLVTNKEKDASKKDAGVGWGEKVYTDKTWVTFSIEQGRDPSLWEYRKALSEPEKQIYEALKSPVLDTSQIKEAIALLTKAGVEAKKISQGRNNLELIKPLSGYVYKDEAKKDSEICIKKPNYSEVTDKVSLYKSSNPTPHFYQLQSQTPGQACYNAGNDISNAGDYNLNFIFTRNGESQQVAQLINFYVVEKPLPTSFTLLNDKIVVRGTLLSETLIKSIEVKGAKRAVTIDELDVYIDNTSLQFKAPDGVTATTLGQYRLTLNMKHGLASIAVP